MTLKHLSNEDFHNQSKSIAETERSATAKLLWYLRENDRRMLYAQMGYKDLKEYCVKELKLSEGSAWRRINAARLLQEIPEVEEKIQSGELNLTQVLMAKSFFKEAKVTKEEKRDILLSIENQNAKATERILAEKMPEVIITKPVESEKAVKGNKTEVTLILDEDMVKDLEEIQLHLGKKLSKLELFKLMTKQTLEKFRKPTQPKRKAQPEGSQGVAKSRYVSKIVIREIKHRDQQQCQYTDPITKKQCEAKHHLQIEHKTPFAKGGSQTTENLQLLCPAHNRLRAVEQFGAKRMQKFLPRIRDEA